MVIAIFGVLAGLLLPAVQRERGTAHCAQCANHLKQIGVALQLRQDVCGRVNGAQAVLLMVWLASHPPLFGMPSTTDLQIGSQVFHWQGSHDARS